MDEKAMQAEDRLKKLLRENPEIAKAYKETLDEMKKPENVEKMANQIQKGIKAIIALKQYAERKAE
jgi:hypothetical protein